MNDRPNILWICTDSQRWDTLGCYGNPWVHTPHADRLAAEGIRFNHAYAQNPLCQPSRGSFLTGRYPVTTGLRQNGTDIPPSEVLVTRRFDEAGYVCGNIGKLHLCACDHRVRDPRPDAGPEGPFKGIEPRINDGYTEFYWDHCPEARYRSSDFTRWVEERGGSFDRPPREDCRWVHHGMPEAHHQTTWCFETAQGFVRRYADSIYPWVLTINPFDPHFPFDPPDSYLERYLDRLDEIPLPNYVEGELDTKPTAHRERAFRKDFGREHMTERDHRLVRAAYWAMCDQVDARLGDLLATLEETGQAENTIVIFMSDHGEMLGDHGIYKKGSLMYDPAVRVPLVVRWPGRWEGGRTIEDLVELSDLAPTLLEAAGLALHPGIQAKSLTPLLDGRLDGPHREDVYSEYYHSNPTARREYATMLRTRDAKLVIRHGEDLGELYDLEKDPDENRNLWDDPDNAGLKAKLMKRAADRMAFTCDPLPERIGLY